MQVRGILFDKDGTLFDFRRTWGGWLGGEILRHANGDDSLAAALASALGYDQATGDFDPASVVIAGTLDEVAQAMVPHLPGISAEDLGDELKHTASLVEPVPVVPLHPFFERLVSAGLRIGIATNDGIEPARAHLDRFGITGLFDFVAGYDSGHGAKPGPGMCLAFADAVGIPPGEVVMVGDSRHDLAAGRAAGMKTAAVLTGIAGPADLGPLADIVLPDIGHLPAWLNL